MQEFYQSDDWKEILEKLANIRQQDDYSAANVEYIRKQLQSSDDRVRAGAALAAGGCVWEPYVLDILLDLSENDGLEAIRKASIQSLGEVIYEGVMRNFEDLSGSDTDLDYYEEWDELQDETLQDDYRRVKNMLLSFLQNEFEDQGVRETSLIAISDLGFLESVREAIQDFIESEDTSSNVAALQAMGKYPQFWIDQLAANLKTTYPKPIIMAAISSSYSSDSAVLAGKIEEFLESDDPEILSYTLLTLANINKTENLGPILQQYSLSENEKVRSSARDALKNFSNKNFTEFMERELGFEEYVCFNVLSDLNYCFTLFSK
jgi:HEAT repeat protein